MPKVSELPLITNKADITADDLIMMNDGNTTKVVSAQMLSNRGGTGYSHTGGFAGKPLTNQYVWENGVGISYTQTDADNEVWKILSLDRDVHLAVDQAYWTNPTPGDETDIGLFAGQHLPIGIDTLFDFDYDFDTEYPTLSDFTAQTPSGSAADSFSYFSGSVGRIDLSDCEPGDQLRIRFDYNIIPQIANTTVEPALWYANRDGNNKETFSFALTANPAFFGTGTVGKTFLNRVEISAWIAQDQDINALALPAIKSDNPVIIQPLGMLATILR